MRGKATRDEIGAPKTRGRSTQFPQQNQQSSQKIIPASRTRLTLVLVPPSDTPDDAMSGEAGPAPGWRALAGTNPRPAATVSLRTRGWTKVFWGRMPRRLDTPIGRTCLRGTQTRRQRCREHPDSGAKQTAGMSAGPPMAMASSPGRGSRSDWCTIRREPPGPPARLKRHHVTPQPDPRPVNPQSSGQARG
mgnify:CR=1 FL=1